MTAQGHFGMSLADLCNATGSSRAVITRLLYRLGSEGKAFSDGRNGAQRYYLYADARDERNRPIVTV
jgi:hypothetical protein